MRRIFLRLYFVVWMAVFKYLVFGCVVLLMEVVPHGYPTP